MAAYLAHELEFTDAAGAGAGAAADPAAVLSCAVGVAGPAELGDAAMLAVGAEEAVGLAGAAASEELLELPHPAASSAAPTATLHARYRDRFIELPRNE